jgi:hypothetical protein
MAVPQSTTQPTDEEEPIRPTELRSSQTERGRSARVTLGHSVLAVYTRRPQRRHPDQVEWGTRRSTRDVRRRSQPYPLLCHTIKEVHVDEQRRQNRTYPAKAQCLLPFAYQRIEGGRVKPPVRLAGSNRGGPLHPAIAAWLGKP